MLNLKTLFVAFRNNPLKQIQTTNRTRHVKLTTYPCLNFQLLGQIDVGTVNIYNLTVPLVCSLPVRVQLEQICVKYDKNLKYLVHGTRARTSRNKLFRTVQTSPVSKLDHRVCNISDNFSLQLLSQIASEC